MTRSIADLSMRLFEKAGVLNRYGGEEILHRYFRYNSIAAAIFFPIVLVSLFFRLRIGIDILVFTSVLAIESFYGACRNALPDGFRWAILLSVCSAAIWSMLGLLLGATTVAIRVAAFGS